MRDHRQLLRPKTLAMIGIPVATASLCFWVARSASEGPPPVAPRTRADGTAAASAAAGKSPRGDSALPLRAVPFASGDGDGPRSFRTAADAFFREHQRIPPPPVAHARLADLSPSGDPGTGISEGNSEGNSDSHRKILVVGDVHGCYDELLELHASALAENGSEAFSHVLLVGDLCNKGPDSAGVIRHVRTTPGWYSVRGNHDDGALAAALGDERRRRSETYRWVFRADGGGETEALSSGLSDDDVEWLSELPYTIRIPGDRLGDAEDTLVVHAGLVPGTDLGAQTPGTMTTVRDLLVRCNGDGSPTHYESDAGGTGGKPPPAGAPCNTAVAWASAWRGPEKVVFGHDARRKLQQHGSATGLDTGAVYGGALTGIILPGGTLVSVPSKEYSPIR
ncbi:unnamed protein product [Pseudo-nitzschia multistriata]|uniref:Calcineurin-like phosphoesterase domain-containing protein n=1 Tax=Pseudo-nitzschia multistriata TaxID=183589 RepID=A0A448ZKL3_9STRA|nr:unnamed protein product [Pseudo-nitzschia multistriata]